jgi:peptidoglycan/LPS O-acetylase OafA/YrhL
LSFLNAIANIFRLRPDYGSRVFGLDLMRAFAILFVVMGHASMFQANDSGFPWIKMLNGVELFFLLSGFLIGGILLKIFHGEEKPRLKNITDFWVRRWFRTLPNYYLILILNIIVVYFGLTHEDFNQFNWKYFFFLQNFSSHFVGFFLESWSLSIEEWFYLFFPIILGAIYLLSGKNKKPAFLVSIFLFLLVPMLLKIFVASKMQVDEFWLGVKVVKVVIYRIDSIALGLLAAFIKYWYPDTWFKSRNITFVVGVALSYYIRYAEWEPNAYNTKVFWTISQSIGCFLLLPKFDSMKRAPLGITKVVTHISLISYSMYLINLSLVAEIMTSHITVSTEHTNWGLYLTYWILVLGFSTLLYKYFEKPMMDLRERLKKSNDKKIS